MRSLPAVLLAACTLAASACKRTPQPATLPEGLGVEQPGGVVTQLIGPGSEIPTGATEVFTTAKDNETRIVLHAVRGAGKSADQLPTVGWWVVEGVAPALAGQARVLVTFDLDGQGHATVSAREGDRRLNVRKAPGPEKGITPSPLSDPDEADDPEADDAP